jgi:hypothetical protein
MLESMLQLFYDVRDAARLVTFFTFFTSTKVQILTPEEQVLESMLQLFYDVRDAARRTEQPRIWRSAGVSICTLVPVKQVTRRSA